MMNEPYNPSFAEQLVEKYRPQLKSFIHKQGLSGEDAEDLLQDVFYQLFKTLNDNTYHITHLSAWIYKVAHNAMLNLLKKRRKSVLPAFSDDDEEQAWSHFAESLFSDNSPTPETEYLRSLVWKETESALSELPPEQREIFELTEFEGMPVKVISQSTGISIATLLSRKHYAVKHLRIRLKELYNDLLEY